jgi:predicted acetyltransferase
VTFQILEDLKMFTSIIHVSPQGAMVNKRLDAIWKPGGLTATSVEVKTGIFGWTMVCGGRSK